MADKDTADVKGEAGEAEPRKFQPPGKAPVVRTCLVSRSVLPETQLMRFVFTPEKQVVPDIKHKLPGRGAYVSLSKAAVVQAVQKNLFARSFKAKVKADDSLPDLVEALMRKDAVASLSMVNKAGQAFAGFDTLQAERKRKKFCALLHAHDASQQGLKKLQAMATSLHIPLYKALTGLDLSQALARDNTVNVALVASPVARATLYRLQRLHDYLSSQAL